jgi:hypothetical protein
MVATQQLARLEALFLFAKTTVILMQLLTAAIFSAWRMSAMATRPTAS